MATERDELIQQYAAGQITWRALRDRGFDDYVQVLAGLAELGLRAPIAPMTGPNVVARKRGQELLRQLLQKA
jgi:regulator of protease activity HflC (stomatin/prohibitin superfamily)